MRKILVTGAQGQVGRAFTQLLPQSGWEGIFVDRRTLDLAQPATIATCLRHYQPDCVINCAAYTQVDRAEQEVELAYLVNQQGPAELARYCADQNIHLVHYSTDYVYGDEGNRPRRETDATRPAGVYAASKLAGEDAIREWLPTATIIRTAWVYAPEGHNFVKTMLRLGRERDSLKVVYDQVGSPTYAPDLAAATLAMLAGADPDRSNLPGIFHYSHEGVCSWYDFALAIFELSGISCRVMPIESHEFPTPVRRPAYSVLSKDKIKQAFGLTVPHWRARLAEVLETVDGQR